MKPKLISKFLYGGSSWYPYLTMNSLKTTKELLNDIKVTGETYPYIPGLGTVSYTVNAIKNPEPKNIGSAAISALSDGLLGFPRLASIPAYAWTKYLATETKKNEKKEKEEKVVKDQKPAGPITYNKAIYNPYAYINTKGDTIRGYASTDAKRGLLYDIKYTTSPGLKREDSKLTTQQESGDTKAGTEYRISRTSDYGKALDEIFANSAMSQPIEKDYSKLPAWQRWIAGLFGYENGGKVYKDLTGALVFPKGETTYTSPQGRQIILNKKLEGKQLPQGSVVKQTVNGLPGDLNNFGELQAGQTGYSRIIKYGATPIQNDTVYTRTNPYGLGFENTTEGNKQGFNSLYYKKQGGRLMRQGGRIIEVPFE